MIFLELRESLQIFYARYAAAVKAAVKFVLSLLFMVFLRQYIGFFRIFGSIPVMAVVSAFCALIPYGAICFVMALVLLADVYEVSLEIALIAAAVLFMIGLIYFGFQPHNAFWLLAAPLAFFFKIPYVIPLIAGLSGSLSGIFPACSGVVVFYLVNYVSDNAAAITGDITTDILEKCMQMIEALVTDREMIFFVLAFAAGLVTVYLIRTLSMDFAWATAVVLGVVLQAAVLLFGHMVYDVPLSVTWLIAGIALSLLITAVYILFVFTVDYSQTERLQFEDDDYVYYVKAVPKIAAPRRRTQQGRNPSSGRQRR